MLDYNSEEIKFFFDANPESDNNHNEISKLLQSTCQNRLLLLIVSYLYFLSPVDQFNK